MLTPNSTLQHGRYRITRPIGQGGMGAVYEGYDNNLKNRIAIKEALVNDPSLLRAFEREAQRLARLRHIALPRVIDHFTDAHSQYLVMDDRACIEGQDLSQMLKQRKQPFPVADVLAWADTLLDALAYLHEEGVIHRDIKPANIKLTPKGQIILLDFGLAKGGVTRQTLIGLSLYGYTPGYAPPEQMEGEKTDERSDLYALGATLYSLLTAQAPDDPISRRTVYLDAFWIDKTEVTNAMFADFVAKTDHQTDAEKEGSGSACLPNSDGGLDCGYVDGADWQHPQGPESNLDGLDNYPVIQASWNDATAYCAWAERRLPTEAEWEKAAGGILTEEESRTYPWSNEAPTGERVNFCDQNCPFNGKDSSINDGYSRTSPVGNYPAGASPYGAFDMAGNVWEWISDSYDSNYYASSPRENPTGPSTNSTKVLRCGSWGNTTPLIRVRSRFGKVADSRFESIGFRCARSP